MEMLESSLEDTDLVKVSLKLLQSKIISKGVKDNFDCLDSDHLEADIKVRYLLQQVCERVREDDKVYDRLVRVLSKLGGGVKDVCEAMRKELDRVEGGKASGGAEGSVCLTEKDVPYLVKLLVSGSHRWEAIGIALGVPEYVRDECSCHRDNPSKLSHILTAWISGSYDGARPATVDVLREALSSELVMLPKLLQYLNKFNTHVETSTETRLPSLESLPQIECQSYDTEVAEGKSTLLEVQVSCSGSESYQWSKDGQPLLDGADVSGVSSNILYIDRAGKGTEGKYSCCVSNGSETVCSDKINLMVIYPPEKEHLIKLYSLMESEVPKDSWPPVGNSTFINLVLIKQSRISRCDYYTVRGDMDDILESKEVVEYEEVFREYREGALVLVEGRPGSGKTTLVHKVTRDWATGRKVLQGAKMVFLITLRLLNFSKKDQSLLEVLEVFYGGEVLRKSVEHDLQECGGKGACFIIDGLDEYQQKEVRESVIHQLIDKKCLPFSMVIVASRPVATNKLRRCCSRRVEVIGFSKSQINEYVETYPFNGSDKVVSDMVSKLKLYLDQHPNVLHMCYLPVHAAMICFLFSQLEGNIPHTETQIYEQFTISTLLRQKTRTEEQQQLKSLNDLFGEEELQFRSICKLAFDMIMNSQQVVSQSDAQVSLSDATSSVLSLLTVEHTSRHYGLEHLYTFHHLTFQEFLAAFHITGLQEQEQLNVITKTKDSEDGKLRNVLKFYYGLIKATILQKNKEFLKDMLRTVGSLFPQLIYEDVSELIYNVQCAFESQLVELCDYVVGNGSLYFESTHITPSDFTALGYVISTASKQVSKLRLRKCIWDKDGVMAFSSVITRSKLNSINCLEIFDDQSIDCKAQNALLYQLPCLEELSLLEELKKSDVHCLARGVQLSQLRILKIRLPLAPCSHPEEVLKLLTFGSHNIKQVYCHWRYRSINFAMWKKWLCYACGFQVFQDSDISWLHLYNSDEFSSLPQERFSYCSEVVLVNCGIDDEGAEILANRLNTSVLENLVLDFNRISDPGAVALAGCIARCSVVQEVSIQCNSIGDSGAIALADALVHCSSLRRLNLQGNGLGDEEAVAIAKAAEGLPNLDLYLHNVNITEECVERILEHRASTKIRAMVFGSSWVAISDAGIDALRSALKCVTLPALKISRTNIYNIEILVAELEHVKNVRRLVCDYVADDTLPTLCGIIKSMNNLQHLECGDISHISSNNAYILSDSLKLCKNVRGLSLRGLAWIHSSILDAVKCCTNLQSLDMSGCKIDSEGVALLFDDHQCWVNLHTLDLRNNNIDSDGAQVLSKVLVHCKNLRCLYLSYNGIGDGGAVALAEGLKDLTSLLELRLGDNEISSQGALALVEVLKYNHLQHLDLSGNRIGPDIISALVDVICADSLQTLDLSRCGLLLDGAVSLSAGLKSCRQLVELDVSSNSFGPLGMLCLAEGLKSCRQLVELDVSSNNIGSHGMSSLAEGLKSCRQLVELNICGNNIDSHGMSSLAEGLKSCRQVVELDISFNNIGSHGMSSLAEGLKSCRQLVELDISHNNIGSHGMASLAEGLQYCTNLQVLDLSDNNITSDGVAAIVGVMKRCRYLQKLHLTENSICVDGAAVLVGGWQHKSMLILVLGANLGYPHESALRDGKKCCSSCDHLLELYYKNDYMIIALQGTLPKLVCSN